jgi:FAD:protein FMN transferase
MPKPAYRHTARAMGTVASIHVFDDAEQTWIAAVCELAIAELERLEQMFSTFRVSSVISQINRGELDLLDAPQEVIEVFDACTWLEHASNGSFEARRHDGSLDPAGFVKGWAADRAADVLRNHGISNFIFWFGGDLVAHGMPATDQRWHIAIADPLVTGATARSVEIVSGAVATSGTSERGNHIWNTGIAELASLTVIGPSLTWADAFATAAFAQGPRGLEWLSQFVGYEGIAIDTDGLVSTTAGFAVTPALP